MNRFLNDLLRQVKQKIDRAVIADRPEHPWLYRNPNALIGYQGRLVAIFQPMARERKNPDFLLARLLAARISLPKEAVCIVVDDATQPLTESLQIAYRNFHVVLNKENAAEGILRALIEDAIDWYVAPIPDDIQKSINVVTSACLRASDDFFLKIKQKTKRVLQYWNLLEDWLHSRQFRPATAHSWTLISHGYRREIRFQRLLVGGGESGLAWQNLTENPSFMTVSAHCERAIRYQYQQFENGVPFGSKHFFTIIIAEDLPERPYDPLWSTRVLAQSRICVVHPNLIPKLDEVHQGIINMIG